MGGALRRHATTVLVAVVTAAVTAGGPALAHGVEHALFAHSADRVDGKHAVAAAASVSDRAGKLVATNPDGRLPNNIIAKAPNADKLDGADSSTFRKVKLGPGKVLTGQYSAWGIGGGYLGDTIHFEADLPSALPSTRVTFIASGAALTTECPRRGQVAEPGWLCVYERSRGASSFGAIYRADTADYGTGPDAFSIYFETTGTEGSWSYGSWAVRAPAS